MENCDTGGCGDMKREGSPNLERIGRKILVLSGKGGVGKSSVAACLALGLANDGYRVGIMDIDFHGPSIPVIFGQRNVKVHGDDHGMHPVRVRDNLEMISIGFFLASSDQAVIWRGPMKMTAIKQFINEIYWSDLDYLVIDAPPGTGDEPLSLAQLIPDACGLIVTTPQEVAIADVRKSIAFCHSVGMRILGVVENMSGVACPHCGETIDLFRQGGARKMASEMQVELLASLPFDPAFAQWADRGEGGSGDCAAMPLISGPIAELVEKVVERAPVPALPDLDAMTAQALSAITTEAGAPLLFAVPTENGALCAHFGHCESFTLVEASAETEPVIRSQVKAPPHEPGLLPRWLADQGVTTVIAGGMGATAQQLFSERGIQVLCGAPELPPLELVASFLAGSLRFGDNVCDH
ncbi:MAG: iron-sulfur cluster carrier protein MrpORP [Candidatus Geothermincolia bacterium]